LETHERGLKNTHQQATNLQVMQMRPGQSAERLKPRADLQARGAGGSDAALHQQFGKERYGAAKRLASSDVGLLRPKATVSAIIRQAKSTRTKAEQIPRIFPVSSCRDLPSDVSKWRRSLSVFAGSEWPVLSEFSTVSNCAPEIGFPSMKTDRGANV
jgi:hypothetical protein